MLFRSAIAESQELETLILRDPRGIAMENPCASDSDAADGARHRSGYSDDDNDAEVIHNVIGGDLPSPAGATNGWDDDDGVMENPPHVLLHLGMLVAVNLCMIAAVVRRAYLASKWHNPSPWNLMNPTRATEMFVTISVTAVVEFVVAYVSKVRAQSLRSPLSLIVSTCDGCDTVWRR